MSEKKKFWRADALAVVRELLPVLTPACSRIVVAGSLRRRKAEVGDIEIVYIAQHGAACLPGDIIPMQGNLVNVALAHLEADGVLKRRLNSKGAEMFGPQNKYLTHVASGLPLDLFSTTEAHWHNYLVCRTGPAASNLRIAATAQARGYKWHPYHAGFTRNSDGQMIPMPSERAVFEFVGLPYQEPWERT